MTFNLWTFLLEVVNFVVLAYVLHRLLYRPLREAIERRRQAVRQTQTETEKAREEAESIKQQLEERLAQWERERQEMIHQAREQAEAERRKMLAEAESTAQRRQEDARRSLERDREEMLQELSGEVVTNALNLAERLLQQSVDNTLQVQLARRLIETLDSLPADEREQMRKGWQTDEQIWVEAADMPDGETLKRLGDAIAGMAGRELKLNVQINPALIGGVRLRIGGHVWDASIAGQLEEAHRQPLGVSTHV
ncbi:MAG: F0F1 ATP synthase subunit B [Blastocatellia bacterium]|nr:F0F1 ATP synthase subunit B [Blastocatellia bacterium]